MKKDLRKGDFVVKKDNPYDYYRVENSSINL